MGIDAIKGNIGIAECWRVIRKTGDKRDVI
jgi:hypothetical protein